MRLVFVFIIFHLFTVVKLSHAEVLPIEPHREWPTRQVAPSSPNVETLTPELLWRIDCAAQVDPLIGRLTAAAPGLNGNVLLVDRQMSQVLVVNSDGVIERVVGQKGEGPGEISGAYRALQLADGRIGIVNGIAAPYTMFGARGDIVFLDKQSDPAGVLFAGGDPGSMPICSVRDMRFIEGKILSITTRSLVSPPTITLLLEMSLLDTSSDERKVIARNVKLMDINDYTPRESDAFELFSGGRSDIDKSGRIAWAVERDNWAVAVREIDGTGFILQREWSPVERTEEMKDKAFEPLGGRRKDAQLFDYEPAIKRIRWQAGGKLWIEHYGAELIPGSVACFDEVSVEGELLRRVYISIPDAATSSRLDILEDGRMVLFEGFGSSDEENDDTIPSVSLYITN
ncbi:hypothetical protein HN388_05235 [bacterium]|nr:hypothetical protein [bacterium]